MNLENAIKVSNDRIEVQKQIQRMRGNIAHDGAKIKTMEIEQDGENTMVYQVWIGNDLQGSYNERYEKNAGIRAYNKALEINRKLKQ